MKRDFTREKLEECSFEEVVAFAKSIMNENAALREQIADLIDHNIETTIELANTRDELGCALAELRGVRTGCLELSYRVSECSAIGGYSAS